jgi:two-component system, chemotaxis family, protein-glutamate methylesterase/glutaminase
MKPIRVLIVEDSAVVREHLRRIISADSRLQVVGMAASGEEALAVIDSVFPDVITMDIHLPGIQGLEATRRIMAYRPTPIVVVSGVGSEEVNLTMQALKAGALSVVEKPMAATHRDYEAMASRLCMQIAIMSEVKVVRQRPKPFAALVKEWRAAAAPYRVLGVATSTGGPGALMELLTGLGDGFSLPVVVVQHMTPSFMEGFASWLASVTPMPLKVMEERTRLAPGRVYLAPCNRHLVIEGGYAALDDSPPVGSHRPAADMMFSSMARAAGPLGIGVLLTGMGEDGASGLCDLHASGGYTIAEDETSAVVYGMPAAAVRLGGASESLPLSHIAPRIRELISARAEVD